MGTGEAVSLVSVNVTALLLTANGALLSDVCSANPSVSGVSSAIVVEVPVGGGVMVVDVEPLPLWWQAATPIAAKPIAPRKGVLDFMVYSLQSLALVGEPASGVFRYGNTVK